MNSEMTIEKIRKRLIGASRNVLTPEEYENYVKMVESMPDNEILQVYAQIMKNIKTEPKESGSIHEKIANVEAEILKKRGLKSYETARYYADFVSDSENERIINAVLKSKSSDFIYLTESQDAEIQNLWKQAAKENPNHEKGVPSDIFFANTIPLLDCEIQVDERERENGQVIKYRVIIDENCFDIVNNLKMDEYADVGMIVMYLRQYFLVFELGVIKGTNGLRISRRVAGTIPKEKRDSLMKLLQNDEAWGSVSSCLITWYAIQISLLNPRTEMIYSHPSKIKNREYVKADVEDRKRIAKYVKKYYLKDDEISEALYGNKEKRKIERKCLVWYVIGHWRTYEDGKKVFVKPYWKGELRKIKQNLDDRERIVEGGINERTKHED